MNLGYVEREKSMHWPAVSADISKIAAIRRASRSKSMAWGLKKRISSNDSHWWNKARREHWILILVSFQEFVNLANAGAIGLFYGYFKTCMTVASPPTPPQKA
jgi:hypothetical protein